MIELLCRARRILIKPICDLRLCCPDSEA